MNRSPALKGIGALVVLMGLWTAWIPFVGPTFGYGMPPGADVPAWEWNASHFQRHVLPGVAAVLAGAMILWRTRSVVLGGAGLALAAGIWMIISPWVPRAWLDGGMGGMGGDPPSTVMQIITPLGYHYVPGMITMGLAAFVIGWLALDRQPALERKRTLPAREVDRTRFDREREPASVEAGNGSEHVRARR